MLRETEAISFVFRADAGSEMSLDFFYLDVDADVDV